MLKHKENSKKIEDSLSKVISFYIDEHELALKASSAVYQREETIKLDVMTVDRMVLESKERLLFCKKLIKREGLKNVMIELSKLPFNMTMDEQIRGLIDLYFYSVNPNKISTEGQRDKKKN